MRFEDLVTIGNAWKRDISWSLASEKFDKDFVTRVVAKINRNLGWTKGSGKTRVCLGWHRQILVRRGREIPSYETFMSNFEGNTETTKWILEFLEGNRDFNDNIVGNNADYAKDFVCVVCIAEVARGYGISELRKLANFLYGILKGKNRWKELKTYYVAANSSREDEDYVPIEYDMENESDEEELAEMTDEEFISIIKEAQEIAGNMKQSSNSRYYLRPRK